MTANNKYIQVKLPSGSVVTVKVECKDIKTLRLKLKDDNTLVVSCNERMSINQIESFVARNEDWINKNKAKRIDMLDGSVYPYKVTTGSTVSLCGRLFEVVVVKGNKCKARILENNILVTVKNVDNEKETAKTLYNFVKKWASDVFNAITRDICEILSFDMPILKVRKMVSRWGVCYYEKGQISLSTYLIFTPLKAIEYVILHELVHFIHHGHDTAFHNEMKKLMPDYKERKELLQKYSIHTINDIISKANG